MAVQRKLSILLVKLYANGDRDTIYFRTRAKDVIVDEAKGTTLDTVVKKVEDIKDGATKTEKSLTNGNIKIDGTEVTVYKHPKSSVSPDTYNSVTVDANGHVTAGTKVEDWTGSVSGEVSEGVVKYQPASARSNIASGEKLSVIAGKIHKWFADLKSMAFVDKVGTTNLDTTLSTFYNKRITKDNVTTSTAITQEGWVADARAIASLKNEINTLNSNVSNVIKESGDIEVHGHNIFFSEKIGRIFGWEDDNVSIHSLSKPYEAGKNNDYRAISIYPKTRVGSIGDAFTCREFTNNKLTEYVLYGSHNSKRVMAVSNSDGNGKTFKSKDWVYLGTHITVPENSIGIIFARRGWYTGKPYGILISNSNTDLRSSYIVGSSHSNKSKETLNQIEEYLYTSLALTVIVNPGTYYLWSCLDPERQESTDNFITSEGMLAVIMTN